MRPVSKKRAAVLRIYAKKRLEFLEENARCVRCQDPATQVHHMAGRDGTQRLLDATRWAAMCAWCHRWVTEHPQQAIAEGYSLPRVGQIA